MCTLDLSVKTSNALDGEGIFTIGELLQCCPYSSRVCDKSCHCARNGFSPTVKLLDIPNFGDVSLREVRDGLAQLGIVQSHVAEDSTQGFVRRSRKVVNIP